MCALLHECQVSTVLYLSGSPSVVTDTVDIIVIWYNLTQGLKQKA